ncbi:P24 [Parapoynx stagnalis nucleopolyhedrovirus]|uniref:P24 n=1 Tax=Parapoynx stagnalis nucleopolyhedrovirus TaxID=2993413 RepID=A0A9E7YDF7_9ABAC|nr:P24 [Parapoynx stagnalis nucleopolyhedrovirus]
MNPNVLSKETSSETYNFNYTPDSSLEVVILTNSTGDHDGYLEASAATKLLAPIAGTSFSPLTNTSPSHKLIKNNKTYIHVFGLLKYLSNYNLNIKNRPLEYYTLKSVICDLLLGVQSKSFDPLSDIKSDLANIQESVNGILAVINNIHVYNNNDVNTTTIDTNALKDILQNLHTECMSKISFSTETLLDNVKAVKDLICMNK